MFRPFGDLVPFFADRRSRASHTLSVIPYYSVEVTRFNNYNAVSQAELNRLLQESGEAKAMWEQKRATNALPGRRGADQLDLQSFKKEEKYANFFDEGTVVTIDKFLKDNGYDFPPNATMSRKIAFVEQDQRA